MGLDIWTVYDHPSDMPEWFVARRSIVEPGSVTKTDEHMRSEYLDEIRRMLMNKGLTCIPRDPNDEPHIVECWI